MAGLVEYQRVLLPGLEVVEVVVADRLCSVVVDLKGLLFSEVECHWVQFHGFVGAAMAPRVCLAVLD